MSYVHETVNILINDLLDTYNKLLILGHVKGVLPPVNIHPASELYQITEYCSFTQNL